MPNPTLTRWLLDVGKDAAIGGVNGLIRDVTKQGQDKVKNALKSAMTSGLRGEGVPGIGNLTAGKDWPGWFKDILMLNGTVVPTIGQRNSGKTTLQVVLSEWIQHQKNSRIFFPGYPENLAPNHIIPFPIKALHQIMEVVQPGDVIILDDAYRFFSSMRTMTRAGLQFQDWVNAAAHEGITLMTSVQDSSDLHKAGLRADVFIFKPPERMFEGSERPQMRPIVKRALSVFESLPRADWVKYAYVYRDPSREAVITYDRPAWMTKSKAKYRGRIGRSQGELPGTGIGSSPPQGKHPSRNPFSGGGIGYDQNPFGS